MMGETFYILDEDDSYVDEAASLEDAIKLTDEQYDPSDGWTILLVMKKYEEPTTKGRWNDA